MIHKPVRPNPHLLRFVVQVMHQVVQH